jgi:hypothetical protein
VVRFEVQASEAHATRCEGQRSERARQMCEGWRCFAFYPVENGFAERASQITRLRVLCPCFARGFKLIRVKLLQFSDPHRYRKLQRHGE